MSLIIVRAAPGSRLIRWASIRREYVIIFGFTPNPKKCSKSFTASSLCHIKEASID